MSIDHGKVLALAERVAGLAHMTLGKESREEREAIERELRALAQPAEAVEGGLGRFGHHPDPATDFEVEVESLQGRLFNARHGIAKMGEQPETVGAVTDAIERAMRFKVGGDPGAVYAKSLLRALEQEAKPIDAAQGAVAWKIRSKHPIDVPYVTIHEGDAEAAVERGDEVTPLYTHPQAAPAQGDGWKLVPEYPTVEMLIAGAVARARDAGDDHHDDAKLIYEAMIAAAPSQEGES